MNAKSRPLFNRKSVRAALNSWDNDRRLGQHPLADLRIVDARHRVMHRQDTPGERGLSLRDVLHEAVEALRPQLGEPDYSDRRWRPYVILAKRLFEKRDIPYLMGLLNIAARTIQRDQRIAIDKIADTLRQWEDESRNISEVEQRQMPFQALPKPPYRLVGRVSLLQELKEKLFVGDDITLYALNGLPGVGKTALAIALANDRELISHFQDGILWAGLGREPDMLSLLGTWASALDMTWDEIVKLNTVEERANAVHRAIGMRRMLLIIDDAWQLESALAFRLGGPNCAHLLTTRLPDIAQDFAEKEAMLVQELSDDAGLDLFRQLAPDVVKADPEGVQTLVQAVGGLPLAIILMTKYVRREALKGSGTIQAVLERLQNAEKRLELEQPQSPVESHPSLPLGTSLSLQAAIALSVESLDENGSQVLQALSIFPSKPNTFPEDVVLAMSATFNEPLAVLQHYGLLESSRPGRYTLHQTITDFARVRLTQEVVYKQVVEFFVNYIEIHKTDYTILHLETDNVFAIFQVAYEQGMKAALVRGVNTFSVFMITTGLYKQAEMQLNRAEQAARSLGDVNSLAEIYYSLGRIARFRGNLSQAEKYLQDSLALTREIRDPEKISATLAELGWVAYDLGDYSETQKYFHEGLILARQIGHDDRISLVLHGLGALAFNHGEHEQAVAYFKESLGLARKIEDQERIGGLLGNLAWVDTRRGNYNQAETHLQEGLTVVREINHRERMSFLLQALGVVKIKQGDDAQAALYLQEGLALAREIGHQDRISAVLDNLGTVACTQGNYTQAEKYFQESLVVARKIGHRERASGILANMSWLEIERGNYAKAEKYLQEGQALAKDIEYRWTTSKLSNWQGELYLRRQKYEPAITTFLEALQIAREIEGQEMVATAMYGLARTELSIGNVNQAQNWGQQSLTIFKAIGHGRATELREWLDKLPTNRP